LHGISGCKCFCCSFSDPILTPTRRRCRCRCHTAPTAHGTHWHTPTHTAHAQHEKNGHVDTSLQTTQRKTRHKADLASSHADAADEVQLRMVGVPCHSVHRISQQLPSTCADPLSEHTAPRKCCPPLHSPQCSCSILPYLASFTTVISWISLTIRLLSGPHTAKNQIPRTNCTGVVVPFI